MTVQLSLYTACPAGRNLATESPSSLNSAASRGGRSATTFRKDCSRRRLVSGAAGTTAPHHLERLLQVRHLQEQGLTLEEIRSAIDPRGQSVRKARIQGLTPNRTAWHHLTVAPGVELHIAAGVAMPPASRLRELVLACHRIFTTAADKDEDSDA